MDPELDKSGEEDDELNDKESAKEEEELDEDE
jgi:hypothetical protein